MARVALCPQCSHELFVADDMDAGAWAKCPECRAYFQIKDAAARDIPQAQLVDNDALAADQETQPAADTSWTHLNTSRSDSRVTFSESSSQTVSDIEFAGSTVEPVSDPYGAEPGGLTERTEEGARDTYVAPERSPSTVTDLSALASSNSVQRERAQSTLSTAPEIHVPAQSTLIQTGPIETPSIDLPAGATLEDSAERIDKWFQKAKSLTSAPSTVPPHAPEPLAKPAGEGAATATPAGTTVETNAQLPAAPALAPAEPEIKLEDRPVLPETDATWEDSERMERLLGNIDGESKSESTQEPQHETMTTSQHEPDSANQWSTEISPTLSVGAGGKPRRKKSALRSIAMTAVAGIIGVMLGCYALLWMAGPGGDLFGVAHYLPAAILPAEFQLPNAQLANTAPPANTEPADTDDERPEVQASFDEAVVPPAEPATEQSTDSSAEQDNYALGSDSQAPANEPPQVDTQGATPLTNPATESEVPAIVNAPTFTADELAVALSAAQGAQPNLVAGDLDDSRDVQRAKGFSYSMLCDLAQKATFVDKTSRVDYIAPLATEADALFRQTLADQHTREEVARIVPKWIASASRKHGGVFFGGTLTNSADKGTVVECQADLGGGTTLTVLVPQAQADRISESTSPMGIVGWIVDKPADQVAGYTGAASQAIFASRLVPLQ